MSTVDTLSSGDHRTRADPDTIRDLTRRARDGDQTALTELVKAATPALRAALAGRAPACDVDDLLQDTWAKAIVALPSMPALHNPLGWLHTIARNTAIDAARAADRRNSLVDHSSQNLLATVADHSPGPEQVAVARADERRATVAARVRKLTAAQRQALRDYLSGLPRTYTANATGSNPGAVTTLLYRARRRLDPHTTTRMGVAS